MSTSMPTLAVSQFTTKPQSFADDLKIYGELGVAAMEVVEAKLDADEDVARRQLARLRDEGPAVVAVQPRVHSLFPDRLAPEPVDPADRLAAFEASVRRFVEVFGEAAAGVTFVTITGRAPGYDFAAAHETARQLYPRLAAFAADHGVRVAFEMLHPVLMNVDTFVATLGETALLVEEVDREAFGYMIDLWNMWDAPAVDAWIEARGAQIFGVQASDWPRGGVRHVDDRLLPGDGRIDLGRLLTSVGRSGYDGPLTLEVLSDRGLAESLWQREPRSVVADGLEGLRTAWRRSRGEFARR